MSVQPEVAEVRTAKIATAQSAAVAPAVDGFDPSAMREVLALLPGDGETFLARSPRRLEVMGGSAAFMGSLVLTLPLAEHVIVAARPRRDGMLWIALSNTCSKNGDAPLQVPLSALERGTGDASGLPDGHHPGVLRAVLGALVAATRSGLALLRTGGLSIAVSKPVHQDGSGCDFLGSVAGAFLSVAASASGTELPSRLVKCVSKHIAEGTTDGAISAADVACALHGQPGALGLHGPEEESFEDIVELHETLAIVGVDSGSWPEDRTVKQARYRAAAFMGRFLIDRMLHHDGAADGWDGMLAKIAVDDYVQRYRDRIPTKMKGREFLDRFGDSCAAAASIEPAQVYKVRSRTEHPIYEHVRARGFADALRRFSRGADKTSLSEAGELMYASHWSYGQRCGLGSVETDLLVNLIRRRGEGAGILGAKITGVGGGGVVCVLMKNSAQANAALEDAVREHSDRTRLPSRVLRGSSAGALVNGVARLST